MGTSLLFERYEFQKVIQNYVVSAKDVITGRLVVIKFCGLQFKGARNVEKSSDKDKFDKEGFIQRATQMANLWTERSHLMRVLAVGEVTPKHISQK